MPVDVVIRLRGAPDSEGGTVVVRAQELLAALHARPGFVRGSVARAVEDDGGVVVLARWADLGSFRRALGNAEVKLVATPLLGASAETVGTYEVVEDAGPGPDPVRLRP